MEWVWDEKILDEKDPHSIFTKRRSQAFSFRQHQSESGSQKIKNDG
ncbi:hypothetical protein [Priestia endophytica]|nr:hypothetical protein [Priestia endophytica]